VSACKFRLRGPTQTRPRISEQPQVQVHSDGAGPTTLSPAPRHLAPHRTQTNVTRRQWGAIQQHDIGASMLPKLPVLNSQIIGNLKSNHLLAFSLRLPLAVRTANHWQWVTWRSRRLGLLGGTKARLRKATQGEASESEALSEKSLSKGEQSSGWHPASPLRLPASLEERAVILEEARSQLERKLHSARHKPSGKQSINWHRQVLDLLNRLLLEPSNSENSNWNPRVLALQIVRAYHRTSKDAVRR